MNTDDSPFQAKVKLECECAGCESKYRIIYFEDEVNREIRNCAFCGELLEEFVESKELKEEIGDDGEVIYTDDAGARYESELIDDDDYPEEPYEDDER